MQEWPTCQVLWVMPEPIDWPDIWLEEETWQPLHERFRWVPSMPMDASQPDLVTVCTSPGFLADYLSTRLQAVIQDHGGPPTARLRVARPVVLGSGHLPDRRLKLLAQGEQRKHTMVRKRKPLSQATPGGLKHKRDTHRLPADWRDHLNKPGDPSIINCRLTLQKH